MYYFSSSVSIKYHHPLCKAALINISILTMDQITVSCEGGDEATEIYNQLALSSTEHFSIFHLIQSMIH